jgi:hypothetical protein
VNIEDRISSVIHDYHTANGVGDPRDMARAVLAAHTEFMRPETEKAAASYRAMEASAETAEHTLAEKEEAISRLAAEQPKPVSAKPATEASKQNG